MERAQEVIADRKAEPQETYLEIWQVPEAKDEEIRRMFDDLRRAKSLLRLAEIIRNGLITAEELSAFTPGRLSRDDILGSLPVFLASTATHLHWFGPLRQAVVLAVSFCKQWRALPPVAARS